MNSDCKRIQEAILDGSDPKLVDSRHIEGCADCRSIVSLQSLLEDPPDPQEAPRHLIGQTLLGLEQPMRARARERRRVSWRVAAAGIASFPAIAACNAAIAWLLHSLIERLVSAEAALASVTVFSASVFLSLAIAYGSLPLMAHWGMRLREEGA